MDHGQLITLASYFSDHQTILKANSGSTLQKMKCLFEKWKGHLLPLEENSLYEDDGCSTAVSCASVLSVPTPL